MAPVALVALVHIIILLLLHCSRDRDSSTRVQEKAGVPFFCFTVWLYSVINFSSSVEELAARIFVRLAKGPSCREPTPRFVAKEKKVLPPYRLPPHPALRERPRVGDEKWNVGSCYGCRHLCVSVALCTYTMMVKNNTHTSLSIYLFPVCVSEKGWGGLCVFMRVCVCERERERDRGGESVGRSMTYIWQSSSYEHETA